MMKFLQSKWMAVLVGAVAFFATMAMLWRPTLVTPPPVAPASPVQDRLKAFDFSNVNGAELDLLITNLKAAKQELEQREQKLEQWDARLQAERQELLRLADQVDKKSAAFDALVLRIEMNEVASLTKLAGTYAEMPAATATKILKEIADDRLLKIMAYMEREPLAAILENLGTADARRAALLTERLRLVVPAVTNAPSTTVTANLP